MPSSKADPRHVGSPGRLMIWRPFKPKFFEHFRPKRTWLAKLSEGMRRGWKTDTVYTWRVQRNTSKWTRLAKLSEGMRRGWETDTVYTWRVQRNTSKWTRREKGVTDCNKWQTERRRKCAKMAELRASRIPMALERYVASVTRLTKFQAAWFLLNRGYILDATLPSPLYPLSWKLGTPHSQSRNSTDMKNLLYLPWVKSRFPTCPICCLMQQWLHYSSSQKQVQKLELVFALH